MNFTDDANIYDTIWAECDSDAAFEEAVNQVFSFYILPSLNLIHDNLEHEGNKDISVADLYLLNLWAGYSGYMSALEAEITRSNLANYHAYLHYCENILTQLTEPTNNVSYQAYASSKFIGSFNNAYPYITNISYTYGNVTCWICRENLKTGKSEKRLECGHVFHSSWI